jgi:hypothetical protein
MLIDEIIIDDLLPQLIDTQQNNLDYIWALQLKFPLINDNNIWTYGNRIVVVENNDLRWGVIFLFHNTTTAGHPGQKRTLTAIQKELWWPTVVEDI